MNTKRSGAVRGRTGRSAGEGLADVAALRARCAELYTAGKSTHEVAAALGITERQARRYKSAVSADVKAAAHATIEGIVEGGNVARGVIVENARTLATVLVDAARGRMAVGDTPALRRVMAEQGIEDLPIETDPQMVNARTKAAGMALGFILAQKVDAHVTGAASLVAEITAIARRTEDDSEP